MISNGELETQKVDNDEKCAQIEENEKEKQPKKQKGKVKKQKKDPVTRSIHKNKKDQSNSFSETSSTSSMEATALTDKEYKILLESEEDKEEKEAVELGSNDSIVREVWEERDSISIRASDSLRDSVKSLITNTDNDKAITEALSDEETLKKMADSGAGAGFDSRIRKKLKHVGNMIVAPFVPRINKQDKAEMEQRRRSYKKKRKRLQKRLSNYELSEYKIRGNGNCQFGSLSDQIYRSTSMTGVIRRMVCKHLKENPDYYSPYVPGRFSRYRRRMRRNGTWGDHITLQVRF